MPASKLGQNAAGEELAGAQLCSLPTSGREPDQDSPGYHAIGNILPHGAAIKATSRQSIERLRSYAAARHSKRVPGARLQSFEKDLSNLSTSEPSVSNS